MMNRASAVRAGHAIRKEWLVEKVCVGYGRDEIIELEIEAKNLVGVYEPNIVPKIDCHRCLADALAQPLGRPSFDEFVAGDEKIVVIVNDGTRPTPTRHLLEEIYPRIADKDLLFVIATGIHRESTQEEYEFIFGKDLYPILRERGQIHDHDARKDPMTYLGKSSNGTEMYINSLVAEAKKVLVIGGVEPHYFAGYAGGRKSFLPGVAGYDTISQNHILALSDKAQALALEGNPVHEDMLDAMKCLAHLDIFSIQTVLDRDHDVYALFAGDLEKTFFAAIDKAAEVFCVDIPEKADIVISAAPYPMDVDLYQSQKALDNGKLALKEGGILIMVGKCRTGIGEEAFYDLLASQPTPQGVLDKIKKEFKLGWHKAAMMAEINLWAESWAVTDLTDEQMRAVHFKPYHDLRLALADALAKKGPDARVIVLPSGSITAPRLARQG